MQLDLITAPLVAWTENLGRRFDFVVAVRGTRCVYLETQAASRRGDSHRCAGTCNARGEPMTTPACTRPRWKLGMPLAVPILAGLSCSLLFASGMLVGSEPPSQVLVPIITPVNVTLSTPPPPPQAPVPIVVTPTAPPSEPEPIGARRLRATSPHVAARCMLPSEDGRLDPLCGWEDGFPAISADGALIATKTFTGDGHESGAVDDSANLPVGSVNFIDTKTGRFVRSAPIISPGEYDPEAAALAKLRAKVVARGAAIQRTLDARKFRSLIKLGDSHGGEHPRPANADPIHAEFAGDVMRIVDVSTHTVIGQHEFGAPSPYKRSDTDDGSTCSGWRLRGLEVWWDPDTKTVLGISSYATGHHCPFDWLQQVVRLP
jgi:hypothetical protein